MFLSWERALVFAGALVIMVAAAAGFVTGALRPAPASEVTDGVSSWPPVQTGGQWRVSCASMDGGVATDARIPMDGGNASMPVQTDTIYVRPCIAGSANCTAGNVRVGYNGQVGSPGATYSGQLTKDTGFEVGPTGADGVGVSMDAHADVRCISEGVARQADVIAGRSQ